MSAEHVLKVEQPYFDALVDGTKPFEVRRNDRAYQRGDTLRLREWGPVPCTRPYCRDTHGIGFTGRDCRRLITYLYSGDPRWPAAIGQGFVVLGLGEVEP